MAKIPGIMRKKCKFTDKEIIIVYSRERGDNYCSRINACDEKKCKYKEGALDPFKK